MKYLFMMAVILTGCADYKVGKDAFRNKDYELAKENLEPLALKYDHMKSKIELADLYMRTESEETHGHKVRTLLSEAAPVIEGKAYFLQGKSYEEGYGVSVDGVRAASLYQKASDTGYWRAKYFLARLFDKGEIVPQDRERAIRYYQEILANHNYETARKALVKAQEKIKKGDL